MELMLVSLPLVVGMITAFLAAKRGRKGADRLKIHSMSASLWYGYKVGNLYFLATLVPFVLLLCILDRADFLDALSQTVFVMYFAGLMSYTLGLILYLPCALIGYNLYARKLAEEEIARTQRQIVKEIEAEKSSEQQSVSKD